MLYNQWYLNYHTFDIIKYDKECLLWSIASASIALKPNFNSYVAEGTMLIKQNLEPSTNILY